METFVSSTEWTRNRTVTRGTGPAAGQKLSKPQQSSKVQHQCNRCEQTFSRKAILQDHLNVHDNKKPHICGTCDMAFARKSDMRRHSSTHVRDKKVFCEECQKGFTRRDVYLQHMRSIHQGSVQAIASKNRFSQQNGAVPEAQLNTTSPSSNNSSSYHIAIDIDPTPASVDDSSVSSTPGKSASQGQFENILARVLSSESDGYSLSYPIFHDQNPIQSLFEPLTSNTEISNQLQTTQPEVTAEFSAVRWLSLRPILLPGGEADDHIDNFKCCMCERSHSTFQDLQKHLVEHLDDFRGGYRYVCRECGVGFVHHFELFAHRDAVKRLVWKNGKCNCCGQTFDLLSVDNHDSFGLHLKGASYRGWDFSRLCYDKRIFLGLGLYHRLNMQMDSLAESKKA